MTKDQLKYKIISGMLGGIARLPLPLLYGLSDVACFTLHNIIGYRKGVVRKNLRRAFPEKSDRELRKIENRFYSHLCDIFVEAAKLKHISDDEIERRISIEGVEEVNEAVERGKSVVLFLGHFGNWEWVTCAARKLHPDALICEIYHPLRDKAMDRVMIDLRSRFGTENIPMKLTARRLIKINQDGKRFICGFIADQRPFSETKKHWTDFLGIDTAYVNGGEVIGSKLGAEYFYAEMLPLRRGHYLLSFRRLVPIEDGQENPYTRAYLKELEKSISRYPSGWLWSHNRWKHHR